MLRRALEGGPVGQDRKTGGAAGFVGLGEGRGIKVGANEPLRGTSLLDFGDQGKTPAGDLVFDGLGKATRRRCRVGCEFDLMQGALCLGGGNFRALVGNDAGEDIAPGSNIRLGRAGGYCLASLVSKTQWVHGLIQSSFTMTRRAASR